ncbi:NAD-dependent epimerase/dehydratase family protein [Parapedobacter sp. 10938]|uniref:NAD-dependent epimerase/dehydratase family protein n=1 Tax=Parapedobacter flavus TaxID=3110225 RepID=UPI002DB9592F|nr:NAD-dependent epimerase/dehydratase family protein [Parapedobacter sp. 10938]MEC3881778.1 NAD-dependent epimerase/dehydratase family protein [Parapedobacter sp. 10938]
MQEQQIIITGANGQLGTELTAALRLRHGAERVVATDIRQPATTDPNFRILDVMDRDALRSLVADTGATTLYHLAAFLSASGEQHPQQAWDLNMGGLLNVLEVARETGCRVFWPSSIAVFGVHAPQTACPQHAVTQPGTVYGISKVAGENWCNYYHDIYGVDVRSIRYPGLISHTALPGGGTTDYAVDIFHHAVRGDDYTCFLAADTTLPMMYMPDAVAGTIQLMEAPAEAIKVRTSYNFAAFSFHPEQLATAIQQHLPAFTWQSRPDFRQRIADSWPAEIDDRCARNDWGWQPRYPLEDMVQEMLTALTARLKK